MKICAAQTRPIIGDIQRNIEHHKNFIALAGSYGADTVIFPELSLTGYEPTLAKALATHQDDKRFDDFQTISNTEQITIGVGVPTKTKTGICISLVLFQPHQARQTYSKQYLHPDEDEFFVNGHGFPSVSVNRTNLALAICYELSVLEHAERAVKSGADMYIASVAKFADGVARAINRLADIARVYSMPVFMANCIGHADRNECAGKTSIWNEKGVLIGQLNDTHEGILIDDTDTQELIEKTL